VPYRTTIIRYANGQRSTIQKYLVNLRSWPARRARLPVRSIATVPEGLINALYIVPILAVLILVHEFGHFFAARAVGAKVEEFGIGIPPRLKGWMYKDVLWSLNWIPFGGFVRVLGEDGKNMDSGSMNAKSPAQRAFFLAAGSAMNLLLAALLMILIVGVQGLPTSNVYVDQVQPGSPAEQAGLEPGDRVVELAGAPIASAEDVGGQTRAFAGRPMSIVFERDGQNVETTVVPRENPPANEGPTGVLLSAPYASTVVVGSVAPGSTATDAGLQEGDTLVEINGRQASDYFVVAHELSEAGGRDVPVTIRRGDEERALQLAVPTIEAGTNPFVAVGLDARFEPKFDDVPPAQVIPIGLGQAWSQMSQMLGGLRDLVTGAAPLSQVAGPIGMGQITSEIVEASALPLWVTLAQLMVLLSLNLAILNLLPLPALDGGRLFFVLVEVLRGGKRIPPEREGVVHLAGMVILIGLMFIVAFLDVGRLLGGGSFLP
jgi:regulator of sigma E protease